MNQSEDQYLPAKIMSRFTTKFSEKKESKIGSLVDAIKSIIKVGRLKE